MKTNSDTLPLKNLPSVVAFSRGVIITDAPLEYETIDGDILPVPVFRHGVMGTQNVNEKQAKKKAGSDDSTAATAERDVRNLQTIESAKVGSDMKYLLVSFQMKALLLDDLLHSCANSKKGNTAEAEDFRARLADFIELAKGSEGLVEVSRRIARNICNGRWLWRNRLVASNVRINVSSGETELEVPDALRASLRDFGNYTDTEKTIGEILASGFRGSAEKVGLSVMATVDLGVTGSAEVFCSQNYEPDNSRGSGKGDLSRSLYKLPMLDGPSQQDGVRIVGQAAFRDAKIWNALRTIDTWYPSYAEGDMPIPVEPQGASLALMQFMRAGSNKKLSAFELFKRLNQIDPASPEGMFCIASLIRGGVFGDSEKNRDTAGDNE